MKRRSFFAMLAGLFGVRKRKQPGEVFFSHPDLKFVHDERARETHPMYYLDCSGIYRSEGTGWLKVGETWESARKCTRIEGFGDQQS